jgi:ABC-type lipoprotein export system ATPase subunit
MVFILGKSGSGKSTLLNLLGALDSFDGGDIVCFSNSLKGFSEKNSEAYRSHLVSFIFQDYHLLDELTVWENITLLSSDSQEGDFFLKQLFLSLKW